MTIRQLVEQLIESAAGNLEKEVEVVDSYSDNFTIEAVKSDHPKTTIIRID